MNLSRISPLMIDLKSTELSQEERELLKHPITGGVLFFSRNYVSVNQVSHLAKEIRKIARDAKKNILIAVDHEGGRVQRFRQEFTPLPPASALGALYNQDKHRALSVSKLHGWLMAAEVRSIGVDFSFSPVLDLNYGISDVIGGRAFHQSASTVSELAASYIKGMKQAGMAATGKHFPGHGAIKADSHVSIPVDNRDKKCLLAADILPFVHLFEKGLKAVMSAHVIYSEVDPLPASFSRIWLQDILRTQLQFKGAIFSDDLSMQGASVVGGFTERAEAALEAGCDMIVACNNRKGAIEIMDNVKYTSNIISTHRLSGMLGTSSINRSDLMKTALWHHAVEEMSCIS